MSTLLLWDRENPRAIKLPIAFYTYEQVTQTPFKVKFTDASPDVATSWKWNFGTGDISTEQNPIYTFPGAGPYVVSLTITKNGRNSSRYSQSISAVVIVPPPNNTTLEMNNWTGSYNSTHLTSSQLTWYNRWRESYYVIPTALRNGIISDSNTADSINMGMRLDGYTRPIIILMRLTKDLRLLDLLDVDSWQRLRAAIKPPSTNPDTKGYRWWGNDKSNRFTTKDYNQILGMVTTMVYIYWLNRNKTSPAGIDYMERYEFWNTFLLQDLIPLYKEVVRGGSYGTNYIKFNELHAAWQSLAHYEYMFQMGHGELFRTRATDSLSEFQVQLWDWTLPNGQIGGLSVGNLGSMSGYHLNNTYSKEMIMCGLDLHLEGFQTTDIKSYLQKLARTYGELTIRPGGRPERDFGLDRLWVEFDMGGGQDTLVNDVTRFNQMYTRTDGKMRTHYVSPGSTCYVSGATHQKTINGVYVRYGALDLAPYRCGDRDGITDGQGKVPSGINQSSRLFFALYDQDSVVRNQVDAIWLDNNKPTTADKTHSSQGTYAVPAHPMPPLAKLFMETWDFRS